MDKQSTLHSVVATNLTRRRLLISGLAVGAIASGARFAGESRVAAQATPESAADTLYMVNAADYVSAFDWTTKPAVGVEVNETAFTPSELTFEVGIGYEFTITNTGTEKHFFTAKDFMFEVATRKTETAQSEVKYPYFDSIEVFPGQWVEFYFIPVAPGTYDFTSGAEGVTEGVATGTITVTGEAITEPVPVFAPISEGTWVQDGAERVAAADWAAAEVVPVELGEYFFKPDMVTLKADQAYKIELKNTGTKKHEFGAVEFYLTAAVGKVQDASGEYKGPLLTVVEVFPGAQVDLYLIPTVAGEYELFSEIEDDYEQGMIGQIVVESAG